ncbi:MAG: hypothetical protein V4644_00325 [Patescibacteria group bacterium]
MSYEFVHISWTAAPLSSEQKFVLRNIAALFLRREDPAVDEVDFTHELVEGRLTRKSKGLFVTFAGTFFHADLGTVGGVRWTVDFLMPNGSERMPLDDSSVLMSFRENPDGSIAKRKIDSKLAAATEASLLS